ncbi:SAE2-domain-containing protein [Jackrogersella minutella]|nr:SAE2-domain-containing protein [Jackrogersella minutella]
MESWFREVGRPALFDALTGACDRIDNDLNAGIRSYVEENARLSAQIESLKSSVSETDQLKEENRSLQRKLQKCQEAYLNDPSTTGSYKHNDDARNLRLPLAPKSVNQVSNLDRSIDFGKRNVDGLELSELKDEHLKLNEKYTKLREKYSELEDAHATLNQRLRDMKKAYNSWRDHANTLNEQCKKRDRAIKKLEYKLDTPAATYPGPSDASFSSDSSVRSRSRQQAVASKFVHSDTSNGPRLKGPRLIPRQSPLIWPPTNGNDAGYESFRSTASASPKPTKTTSGLRAGQRRDATPCSEGHANTQDGDAASLPPLPRNRDKNPKEVHIKDEPSSDAPVVVSERCLRKRKHDDEQTDNFRASTKVKTEDDSDPLITDERRQFVPRESIDFDAEGGKVDTPRKRNRAKPNAKDVSVLDFAGATRSHTGGDHLNRCEDPMQDTSERDRSLAHLRLVESLQRRRMGRNIFGRPLELQVDSSSALFPLDRSTMPRQEPRTDSSSKRNEPSYMLNGLSSLLEDDDQHDGPKTSTKTKAKSGRLQLLLDNPSLGNKHATPPRLGELSEFPVPQRRELPFGKGSLKKVDKIYQLPITPEISGSRRTSTKSIAKQVSGEKAMGDTANNTTPLRERPESQLGINDFKINSNVNEGYDYAFTDVVRNKDERANLAGCVQEGCCGQKFRLQARAQRDQTGSSDFQVLLENYLGDDAWKLSTMTKPEKEELWIEAKTQELANEHGKHRHRFHRATSPAGFWRTDFPSTQEEQKDKEEAAKMERHIINQRYREAMRPGGRWLFRDE